MQTVRRQYWRYSLIVLILGMGAAIFIELRPFLGGVLGAATIYVLLRRQMWVLTERRQWRRSWAALLLVGEAVVVFLIPITLIIWLVVIKVQDVTLDPRTLLAPVRHIAELVRQRIGYDLWQESNLSAAMNYVPEMGQWLLMRIFGFGINVVVLLFVLYFMLIGGLRMEAYVRDLLPFSRPVARALMREVHLIVRSNAIVIPLLAVVQGVVACAGYYAFGTPSPLFWGVVTCFATVIPLVGTALVWLPLALYMTIDGQWGQAVGLVLYGGVVVTHVDNLVRLMLQRRMADTHPLVTIFGVVVGLSLFGFMGVIFGPLMLAMFIFCVGLFKRKYLDCTPDDELFPRRGVAPRPPGAQG